MTRIFVEGRDKVFMEVYLAHLFGRNEGRWEVVSAGGYTKLPLLDLQFKENSEAGGMNLDVFDADFEENGGGFVARKSYLQARLAELALEADLFLFPNDKADGDFETLLENIVNKEHECLLRCFEQYERCVAGHCDAAGKPKYLLPTRKAKIYAYVESIKKSRREAERFKGGKEFFFDDSRYWDLNSSYLFPLRTFLETRVVG